VPLSDLALEIIAEADKLRGDNPFLFASPKNHGRSLRREALTDAMDNYRSELGVATYTKPDGTVVPDATPHCLRKTMATFVPKLGFTRFVVSRVLNHSEEGVTGRHYDFHDYLSEKRNALDAWARKIREIVNGPPDKTNVIDLRQSVSAA
jgi:integrase